MKKYLFPTPAPSRGTGKSRTDRVTHGSHDTGDTEKNAEKQGDVSQDDNPRRSDSVRKDESRGASPGRRGQRRPPARKHGAGHDGPPSGSSAHHEDGAAENLSLLPGIKPVTELLHTEPAKIDVVFIRKGRKGRDTDEIIDLCRRGNVRFSLTDDTFLEKLWPGRNQGVIARLFASGFVDLEDLFAETLSCPLPLIIALDQVQDPGNAGAIARTLYALGGGGLIIPRHNGVYLGAAAARVAAGALEKLPVAKPANLGQALDAAKNAGFTIYGAHSGDRDEDAPAILNAFDITPEFPAVLVLGSEDAGIRPGVAKRCDALVRIPFARAFDSLNVAQAGAVIVGAFAAKNAGM